MGVSQAIANGLMGRCEMVWSTAGTNRVCSRCLSLKDSVVGHTDESGVTLPPLHPRCRCVIMYREIGALNMQPKTKPNHELSNEKLEPRTPTEAKAVADRLNPVVGKYFTRKSKWSGRVAVSTRGKNSKHPNCTIEIDVNDCPDEALLHELVHAYSTSYYSNEIYKVNSAIEEASVQFLTQEIAKAETIRLTGSGYDFWVEILREVNRELNLYETDLKFAQKLLRVPMTFRLEWLYAKTRKALERKNATLEQTLKASGLLDALSWEALKNELQRIGTANKRTSD